MTARADSRALAPGLALLGSVAAVSWLLGRLPVLTPLVPAIALGALVTNSVGLPSWARPGVAKHSLLLETAIVLLGASLSLDAIVAAGPRLVALVVGVVVFGLALVTLLSRAAAVSDRLGTLLAAGSCICGVSAIAAVAPACDADETQIAHAAATILLFDAVTLVAFPAVGHALHLDATVYGVWIGLSMFSTGPVAAAGFAHSATAGEWATMTKLARNALIGLVAAWYSIRYTDWSGAGADDGLARLWTDFPKFLVGFAALAVLASSGLLSKPVLSSLETVSDALFLLAFAGLGFEIHLDRMREAGLRPVGVVGVSLLVVSGVTYVTISWLF